MLTVDGTDSAVAVAARVRNVVAERLGVDPDELVREVSLLDDLAADSLDLVEIALAIEDELGIVVPQCLVDELRTVGQLVDAVLAQASGRAAHEPGHDEAPVLVRARIARAAGSGGALERVCELTPYTAQAIFEDAGRAGHGACLELTVALDATEAALAWVREEFGRLGARGVRVHVRRGQPAAQ